MTDADEALIIEEMERLTYTEDQLLRSGYRWHPCARYETTNLCWCKYRYSMTSYHYEGEHPLEDPNKPILMCDDCAKEYEEMMTSQWNDYYAGRL